MRVILPMVLGAASFALVTGQAEADSLSYSFWEIAYQQQHPDDSDLTFDGFGLALSAELTPEVFVFGSYADLDDTDDFGIEGKEYRAGLGYAYSMKENLDLVGTVSYARAELDVDGFEFDDDGYAVSLGMRSRPADRLEVGAAVSYVDLSDSGDDTSVSASAQWYFTDQVAIAIGGRYSDLGYGFSVGVRGTWGRSPQR